MSNFGFAPANCLDISLIENDAVGADGKVKDALLSGGDTFEGSQNEATGAISIAGPRRMGSRRAFWPILHENNKIADSTAEFGWE